MNKKVFSILLVLISLFGSLFFRIYHRTLPFLDTIARQEVSRDEYKSLEEIVKSKYQNLDSLTRSKLLNNLYKEKLKEDKLEIEIKTEARSKKLKDRFRDEKGDVYLSGIDSYYWLRLLNNLIERGKTGITVENGIHRDEMLVADAFDPASDKNVNLWLGFIFYKTASIFNKDVPLDKVVFYVPVFLLGVIIIFSFLLSKRLSASDIGAFFASVAIGCCPFFTKRLAGEWFDTDIYNVFFPLIIFGLFVYCFDNRSLVKRVLLSLSSGLALALYSCTWRGWWFIFDIIMISGLFFVINQKQSQPETGVGDDAIKDNYINLGLFFLFSCLFVNIFSGFSVWKDFIAEPMRLVTVLKAAQTTLWPNVYLTVAELEPIDNIKLVNYLGGIFIFFSSLIGLLWVFVFGRGSRSNRIGFGLWCIIFWILGTISSALEAVRFVLLLVIPIGLCFGIAVTKIYEACSKFFDRVQNIRLAYILKQGFLLCFSVIVLFNAFSKNAETMLLPPAMDDYWHDSLLYIRNNTSEDAIVDSWWDFGHWFKAVAKRRTLFDGMTQNTPYAYWIANALLTENEDESLGILRMINSSGNKAAETLQSDAGMSAQEAVNLIKKVIVLKENEAAEALSKKLTPEVLDKVMEFLFTSKAPDVYFVISSDMVDKIGAISFIGNWDFNKVQLWINERFAPKKEFMDYAVKKLGLTADDANMKYLEMSMLSDKEAKAWFSYRFGYPSAISSSVKDEKLLFFDNGLVVDLSNMHAYVSSEIENKRGRPKSLLFMENGRMKEVLQNDSTLNYSGLLIQNGTKYEGILLDPAFGKSMLLRLYFFKGKGLKNFQLVSQQVDEDDRAIYIYKVLWK